jgi:hypothetical protein
MQPQRQKKVSDPTGANKKNIGVKVDEGIWRQFRALAISQGKTAGDLLDELMTEYVAKAEKNR